MTTPPTLPQQPQPGGNDGYGVISGAPLRRDTYTLTAYVPGGTGWTYTPITAVHQLNTAKANPSIYLPQMDVIPGDTWRFSFRTLVDLVAAVGDPTVRLNAEWYNSSNVMLGEDSTPFVTFRQASVSEAPDVVSHWQPTLEVTVPAGVASVHIVAEMKCVNPVNSWAIYQPSYVKI